MLWTKEEVKVIDRYFRTNITEMTLYKHLYKINPHRTYEAMMRKLRRCKEEGRERDFKSAQKSLKIGYLDIEASALNGTFGIILSWFIKERNKNNYDSSVITKKELFNYEFDKRVVIELLNAIKKYDVLYTHYGCDRRFDIPMIRTRAYRHELQNMLPVYMEKFIMDTWPIARNKLRLHSNRLDAIGEAVGIKHVKKTPISPRKWELAHFGHPDALKYVVSHNKRDVQLLEAIHKKLETIEKPIYRSM